MERYSPNNVIDGLQSGRFIELKNTDPAELSPEELGKLFYREIALDYLPGPDGDVPEEERLAATLHGAATLEMNGNVVSLRGHQLFLFNALLYLRHKEGGIAYSDVASLGLNPGAAEKGRQTSWDSNLKQLVQKINQAAGTDALYPTRSGRWRRYHVHPGLELELGENFERWPEGFYEFAQLISGDILRMNIPEIVTVDKEEPLEVLVRDDDTIVVNNVATQLNQHDRSLLHLLTFNKGRPLSLEQIFALGFHAYGPPGQAKRSALYRAFHRLDDAFSGNDERRSFYLQTQREGTTVRTLRSYKLVDLRQLDTTKPRLRQATDDFEHLLDLAPRAGAQDELPHAELIKRLRNYGARKLTLTEAYTLSLRLGIELPYLHGTTMQRRMGLGEVQYDNLVPFIIPGTPLPRTLVGELLGGQHDGTVHSSEEYAYHKLKNADKDLEILRKSRLGRLLIDTENTPESERTDDYLSGHTITSLLALVGRPQNEQQALAAMLLPAGVRRKPRYSDALNGLVWVRRVFKDFMDEFKSDPVIQQSILSDKYEEAARYFRMIIGSPSQGVRSQSFADLAESDPSFAEEGQQLIADLTSVLLAYKQGGKPVHAARPRATV